MKLSFDDQIRYREFWLGLANDPYCMSIDRYIAKKYKDEERAIRNLALIFDQDNYLLTNINECLSGINHSQREVRRLLQYHYSGDHDNDPFRLNFIEVQERVNNRLLDIRNHLNSFYRLCYQNALASYNHDIPGK